MYPLHDRVRFQTSCPQPHFYNIVLLPILQHELRTPLQGIMGITSLMLEQQDYERDSEQLMHGSLMKDHSESLGLIMASSSLLLNLINNLLDVKKATANSKCKTRMRRILR